MKKISLTFLFLLSITFSFAHKSYVSIANMDYNPTLNQIEVSLKLTAHDFEHILENKFGRTIHLETVLPDSEEEKFIINYLKTHFKISSDDKGLEFNYVGKEVNVKDELYFYFTLNNVTNPKKITVVNTFLFEIFQQQQNLIHYKYESRTKSVTLILSKQKGTINHN